MKQEPPNPGSKKAIDVGCTCPVLDNSHGKGYMGISGMFVFNESCKIHGPEFADLQQDVINNTERMNKNT